MSQHIDQMNKQMLGSCKPWLYLTKLLWLDAYFVAIMGFLSAIGWIITYCSYSCRLHKNPKYIIANNLTAYNKMKTLHFEKIPATPSPRHRLRYQFWQFPRHWIHFEWWYATVDSLRQSKIRSQPAFGARGYHEPLSESLSLSSRLVSRSCRLKSDVLTLPKYYTISPRGGWYWPVL